MPELIPEITTSDYILLPFYLLLIYWIAYHYRNKYYPKNHPWRPYFISGLTAKIAGAIFIGLIYNYYYHGGDTFNYFFHSQIINSTFNTSPMAWLRLITHHADTNVYTDSQALSDMYWYDDGATYTTSCLGAFIGLFCFTKYLVINVIIASLSFFGMWLMFVTFARQYQTIVKYIAIAILFMPGPTVWGSGLFKDSFCMLAIGGLVYSMAILLEKKEFKPKLLILTLISIALLFGLKLYILAALLPVLIVKALLFYKKDAAHDPQKKIKLYVIIAVLALVGYRGARLAINYAANFSVDNILETVKTQKDYLLRVSIEQDGSAYDLGDFEPTISGIARMIVPAINVTLFRPYIWETKNVIQIFSAIESAGLLLFTLFVLLRRNIAKTIKRIYHDPNLLSCLAFSLMFAFIVGVSSYNFGTLSRYKIPCIPFYTLFLVILFFNKEEQTPSVQNPADVI